MTSALLIGYPNDPLASQQIQSFPSELSKQKKRSRRKKQSQSALKQSNNGLDILAQVKEQAPSEVTEDIFTKEPSYRSPSPSILSRNQAPVSSRSSVLGGSNLSKRKTSVDQRQEAEAEMNHIERDLLAAAGAKIKAKKRKATALRQLDPLLVSETPAANELLQGDVASVNQASLLSKRRTKKKKRKPLHVDTNAVPFPEDPFDAALAKAVESTSNLSKQSKTVTKKPASLNTDAEGLQQKMSITLNVDAKKLANEMLKNMGANDKTPEAVPTPKIAVPKQV